MATEYIDGEIVADSFLATMGGQSFVVNNLSLNHPQVAAERNDHTGVLDAKVSKQDEKRWEGTAEIQVAASANNIRLQFETFVVPADASGLGYPIACVVEAETSNVVVNESRVRTVSIRYDTRLTVFEFVAGGYQVDLIVGELEVGDVPGLISHVTIGDAVTGIGILAFLGNSLTIVTLPESVTSIGNNAFTENILTIVILPESLTSIGDFAFSSNFSLSTVNCYTTKTVIDAASNVFLDTASPLTIHARADDATWTAGTGLSIGGNTNVTVIKDL